MPKRRKKGKLQGLVPAPTIEPSAAGVDVGATEIYIAVPPDRDTQPVRRFQTFTEDLRAAADWLERCGIETVAMESTGVYWIPLFQMLESRGLKVCLVNARHVKNVPGRKTDVKDAAWLADLLAHGLIRASFVPDQPTQQMRDLLRTRKQLVRERISHTQRIQKALEDANIKLDTVVTNILGLTGRRILQQDRWPHIDPLDNQARSRRNGRLRGFICGCEGSRASPGLKIERHLII